MAALSSADFFAEEAGGAWAGSTADTLKHKSAANGKEADRMLLYYLEIADGGLDCSAGGER